MPSFERISMAVAKEVGDKEMRHVKCVDHATNIKLFSLLLERKNYSRFWKPEDQPLEFSLLDILEPGSSLPETDVKGPLTLSVTVLNSWKVAVTADTVVDMNVSVAAAKLQESLLQYQIVIFPPPKFERLRQRKLLHPEPSFMQQYRRARVNLYVVTKTVELLNSPVLSDSSSGSVFGSLESCLPWNPATKAQGAGEHQKLREKQQTLQKGMVLAYKRKQLVFSFDDWDVIEIADDKLKTFEELTVQCATHYLGDLNFPIGRAELATRQGFKGLEEEVISEVKKVAGLSGETQAVVFVNIQALLEDRQALQDLVDTLEQGKSLGHLKGPGAAILNELRTIPGYPDVDPVHPILYLLGAIMVLSDTQHAQLAWSMDRKILLGQQELVRSILEPNFKYPWSIPFTLSPQLLAPLRGEAEAVTYGLLEECGLRMEEKSPSSTWNPEAREPLSALYASLCILQWLAEA